MDTIDGFLSGAFASFIYLDHLLSRIARQGRERHMPLQSHIANISIMVIAVSLAVGTILQFRWWHWTSRHSL